jgi:hypothetical protein
LQRPTVRILVLIWQVVWLTAVAPGHTRGQIKPPGEAPSDRSTPAISAVAGCCMTAGADDPDPLSASECAVCDLLAMMTPATAIVLIPPVMPLVRQPAAGRPVSATIVLQTRPGSPRGPPMEA